jgi:uncharacterized OB-fold protein
MSQAKTRVAAVEGWFTMDEQDPRLLGSRCTTCGTFFFPPTALMCRNPQCDGSELETVPLSRRGRVWSYTVNRYQPPPPYVAADPFSPYPIAAVELTDEKMVVLGQVVSDGKELAVGNEVELVLDTLYEDEDHQYMVWKWAPA